MSTSDQSFPFPVAHRIAKALVVEFSPVCERIEIAGSLRRQKNQINDIELVCIPRYRQEQEGQQDLFGGGSRVEVNQVWEKAEELAPKRLFPLKPGTDARDGHLQVDAAWREKRLKGSKYFRFWLPRVQIKVDMFLATPETWGPLLVLRTGSADFNRGLVSPRGSHRGRFHDGRIHYHQPTGSPHTWSNKGAPLGPPVDTPEEKDVFEALELAWVEPTERRTRADVEKAARRFQEGRAA